MLTRRTILYCNIRKRKSQPTSFESIKKTIRKNILIFLWALPPILHGLFLRGNESSSRQFTLCSLLFDRYSFFLPFCKHLRNAAALFPLLLWEAFIKKINRLYSLHAIFNQKALLIEKNRRNICCYCFQPLILSIFGHITSTICGIYVTLIPTLTGALIYGLALLLYDLYDPLYLRNDLIMFDRFYLTHFLSVQYTPISDEILLYEFGYMRQPRFLSNNKVGNVSRETFYLLFI